MTVPTVGVFGRGRLGRAIAAAAGDHLRWHLAREAAPVPAGVDVAIEASSGAAVPQRVSWALESGTPLVIGSTGWELPDLAARVGDRIGVVVAPNFSLGVALLRRLTAILGRFCAGDETRDPYLIEHHQARKHDAPSGTARLLAATMLEACPRKREWRIGGPIGGDALSVAVVRAGHTYSEHVVGMDAPDEVVELRHMARSAGAFAAGALAAAAWIASRTGVHTMDEVAAAALDPLFAGEGAMTVDLRGLHVALATPFRAADGAVDEAALRRLVQHVVGGGVDVLLALGTTGEATALDGGERDRVVATCLEHGGGRPVMVGVGAAATASACAYARRAAELGAHALLVVTPYYVRPTQDGLVAHVAAVADAAGGLPLVVYNVPGRTAVNLLPATMQRLWQLPTVAAIKESSGSLPQIGEIARTLPAGKVLLAGDDGLALPSIAVGAEGLVSVVANLLPAATARLVASARAGQRDEARQRHARLLPVIDALFAESSPSPLKAGLAHLGLIDDRLRLPLLPATAAARERLAAALDAFPDTDAR